MATIKVILGSTRENRAGEKVAKWVMSQTKLYSGDLDFDFIDLRDINLPFIDEPISPMASDDYKHDHTRKWSALIQEADGLVIITPEYNHGYPAVLKNALDFLYNEWENLPVALVGYGGSGARSSIGQLRPVLEFMRMKPLEDQVGIGKIWEAFEDNGDLKADHVRGDIHKLLSDLENLVKQGM